MRRPAVLVVLAAAAPAFAGELRWSSLTVKEGGASDTVTLTGTLPLGAELVEGAPLALRLGAYAETVPAGSLRFSKKAVTYKAPKKSLGILKFSYSLKKGTFTLSAKGRDAGDLSADVAVTLEFGGRRVTSFVRLAGTGPKRAWTAGMPMRVKLTAHVLDVTHALGTAVLAPAANRTFASPTGAPAGGVTVVDADRRADAQGVMRATLEATDPDAFDAVDLAEIFGTMPGRTPPGLSRITAGDDGECDAAVLTQSRAEAQDLHPGTSTVYVVSGAEGAPSGSMSVAAGAVAADVTGVTFSPLAFGALLPAPLPADYTAVAGAEVAAAASFEFVAGQGPTFEVTRPRWVEAASLVGADLRVLQFRDGAWAELDGLGVYDATRDRLLPDATLPARLLGSGAAVYAAREGPSAKPKAVAIPDAVRGRVVDEAGEPVPGQVVLSRNGVAVSDPDGSFAVEGAALTAEGLEMVQTIGGGRTTARVVSGASRADELRIVAPDAAAPLERRIGRVSGTVWEGGRSARSPGAKVTVRAASAVRGMTYDDRGTPTQYLDDVLTIASLADLGVRTFEWTVLVPGSDEPFRSSVTGRSISPSGVLLEAQAAGRSIANGAYTVRARYTVPGLGEVSAYAGFRKSVVQFAPAITDVQLPAAVDPVVAAADEADGDGLYEVLLEAPLGIPMSSTAVRADGLKTDTANFLFDDGTVRDLVFPLDADPVPPPGVPLDKWTGRASLRTARKDAGSEVLLGRIWVAGGLSTGGSALSSMESYDPTTNTWTYAAPMSVPRDRCELVAAEGRLYAIGGHDGTDLVASVEVYDPATDSWSGRASMAVPREDVKAVYVAGRIWACGGTTFRGGAYTDPGPHVEVYDPVANAWSPGPSTISYISRGDAMEIGGKVVVFGNGGYSEAMNILDPATSVWSTFFSGAGGSAPAAVAFRGNVVAFGLYSGNGRTVFYDLSHGSGLGMPGLGATPASRQLVAGAAEALNDTLYTIGGEVDGSAVANVDAYRPAWLDRTLLPAERAFHAAAFDAGSIYVAGGSDAISTHASVDAYDTQRGLWTAKAPMSTARRRFGLVAVQGLLYAVGGETDSGTPLASVEAFDPVTDAWTPRAPLSRPRVGAVVAEIGGSIYAAGGGDATLERYDPATNTWTPRAPMSVSRQSATGAVSGGRLFVFGGNDGGVPLGSGEVYDPATNAWTPRATIPGFGGREDLPAAVVGGKIYAIGGYDRGSDTYFGPAYPFVHAYDVVANTWAEALNLPFATRGAAAVVVDGTIWELGGQIGSIYGWESPNLFVRNVRTCRPE